MYSASTYFISYCRDASQRELSPLRSPDQYTLGWSSRSAYATFDYNMIEGLRQELERSDVEIQQYFTSCGIQPFKVVYEDFVDSYEETALQILDYLHISAPENLVFKERVLQKLTNAQSEEWLQRYYQLKQQEELNGQDMNTMPENAAQRYIQADVRPPDSNRVNWKAKPLPFKLYRNCEQIALSQDTREGHIGQMLIDLYGLTRQTHSVAMFHPMLKYLPRGETHVMPFYVSLLRPVPSGGGLFPCELYLLVGPGQPVSAGVYHYDVVHHALDILVQGDCTSLLQSTLAHPADTPPAYTLLLSSYFWKDGFKYGAFSYRLQGLDIGTIISQSEILTHHEGLSTTIHYQFQDKVLNDLLGLDPLHESVYAVIEWRQTRRDRACPCPSPSPSSVFEQGEEPLSLRVSGTEFLLNPTESIARWPLLEEAHRASLIETREAFRPLHSLAPIQSPHRREETLPLSATQPLDLWAARSQRRSTAGSFLPTPLTKQQLSQLLRTSMRGTTNDLDGHTNFLQHTLLYCVVLHVYDIPPGIYVYKAEKHKLELVHAEVFPYELYQALSVPNFDLFHMSVSLFPVGNYTSGFQVYGDRWYRMQNMEAGIIAQRLYLAAAAQNLGCRASLSFGVSACNRFLGLLDTENKQQDAQCTSLIQIMIAPERSAHQYYEQSLLI